MSRAVVAWEWFWFAERPVATLALLRIAFALVTLAWAATLAPDVDAFYGADGLAGGSRAAPFVLALLAVAAGLLLVGHRPRLSAATVFCCLTWFDAVNGAVLNAGDLLLRNLAFVLALAPGGPSPAERPVWPIRLVQLQVSVMYLAAVAWKLQGAAWRDGTAVSYPLRIPGVAREPLPDWFAATPGIVQVLTWGTIALELALALLVWNRRARPWVLATGVVFHLSIEATLAPGFLSWAVLVAYLAFVPPDRAARLLALPSRVAQQLSGRGRLWGSGPPSPGGS